MATDHWKKYDKKASQLQQLSIFYTDLIRPMPTNGDMQSQSLCQRKKWILGLCSCKRIQKTLVRTKEFFVWQMHSFFTGQKYDQDMWIWKSLLRFNIEIEESDREGRGGGKKFLQILISMLLWWMEECTTKGKQSAFIWHTTFCCQLHKVGQVAKISRNSSRNSAMMDHTKWRHFKSTFLQLLNSVEFESIWARFPRLSAVDIRWKGRSGYANSEITFRYLFSWSIHPSTVQIVRNSPWMLHVTRTYEYISRCVMGNVTVCTESNHSQFSSSWRLLELNFPPEGIRPQTCTPPYLTQI